jgi:hypothetical protein
MGRSGIPEGRLEGKLFTERGLQERGLGVARVVAVVCSGSGSGVGSMPCRLQDGSLQRCREGVPSPAAIIMRAVNNSLEAVR